MEKNRIYRYHNEVASRKTVTENTNSGKEAMLRCVPMIYKIDQTCNVLTSMHVLQANRHTHRQCYIFLILGSKSNHEPHTFELLIPSVAKAEQARKIRTTSKQKQDPSVEHPIN